MRVQTLLSCYQVFRVEIIIIYWKDDDILLARKLHTFSLHHTHAGYLSLHQVLLILSLIIQDVIRTIDFLT